MMRLISEATGLGFPPQLPIAGPIYGRGMLDDSLHPCALTNVRHSQPSAVSLPVAMTSILNFERISQ